MVVKTVGSSDCADCFTGFADQRMAFSVLLPVKQKEFQLFSPDLNPAKAIFADLLFKTSVSPAEILSGLAIMADGRRRLDLEAAARSMFLATAPRRSATESLISTQS